MLITINKFFVSILFGLFTVSGIAQSGKVLILNDSVPDTATVIIDSVLLKGNAHTRPYIITRELLFKSGDSVLFSELKKSITKSCENLLNLSIFNFVTPEIKWKGNNHIVISLLFTERWYVWPYPIFEIADRNFNAWWRAKNFSRVNYGVNLEIENFRGRRESLAILAVLGFDQKLGLKYFVPFINHKQTLGLTVAYSISANHEIACATDSMNQIVFVKSEDNYLKTEHNASIGIVYRPDFYLTHTLDVGLTALTIGEEVLAVNPEYGPKKTTFLNLGYLIKDDHRDFKHYPLKGYYADAGANKIGIPFIDGNSIDYWSVEATFRKYWKVNNKWFVASGVYGKLAGSKPLPYFIQSGLGYGRYFVRGYEYYVIDGQKIGLIKTNLKYALIPTRVIQIEKIKSEKFSKIHYAFYLNLFTDAGYAAGKINNHETALSGKLLYSAGLGLDFVTYYDKVLRIEYTVNKQGESGFYIHFIASI